MDVSIQISAELIHWITMLALWMGGNLIVMVSIVPLLGNSNYPRHETFFDSIKHLGLCSLLIIPALVIGGIHDHFYGEALRLEARQRARAKL